MENDQNKFEYTYSAPTERERREILSIRRQYEDETETTSGKMKRLRRLDSLVRQRCIAYALSVGVIGCLIFGMGLTSILEFAVWALGVPLCVVGAIVMALAYPLHSFVRKRYKAKYGEEILRLSEELLGQ